MNELNMFSGHYIIDFRFNFFFTLFCCRVFENIVKTTAR